MLTELWTWLVLSIVAWAIRAAWRAASARARTGAFAPATTLAAAALAPGAPISPARFFYESMMNFSY